MSWAGWSGAQLHGGEDSTLLRLLCILKLMEYLFLEFFIKCFGPRLQVTETAESG